MTETTTPQPMSAVERTAKVVAEREHTLLTEIRDLSVKAFKLRLARDEIPQDGKVTARAATDFRMQQRKVSTLVEDLSECHMDAIKARAEADQR